MSLVLNGKLRFVQFYVATFCIYLFLLCKRKKHQTVDKLGVQIKANTDLVMVLQRSFKSCQATNQQYQLHIDFNIDFN